VRHGTIEQGRGFGKGCVVEIALHAAKTFELFAGGLEACRIICITEELERVRRGDREVEPAFIDAFCVRDLA
jgi:hypothetical protein